MSFADAYLSYFLAFRRFASTEIGPNHVIANEHQLRDAIEDQMTKAQGRVGLLLSAGMDSAILAHYLPPGSIAYTIDYEQRYRHYSEFEAAAMYVPPGVLHKRIEIDRASYFNAIEELTMGRQAPTVPHEAAVYLAAKHAAKDGVQSLVGGFGADGRLGGFPAFYRNAEVEKFKRFLFGYYFNPLDVLVHGVSVEPIIERFVTNGKVDVLEFLTIIGTEGNSAAEAIRLAGVEPVLPFTTMALENPPNPDQPEKHIIRRCFELIYGHEPISKFALYVPYEDWLSGIRVSHPEFLRIFEIETPLFQATRSGVVGLMVRALNRANRAIHHQLGARRINAKRGYLLYSVERYLTHREQQQWKAPARPFISN